MIIIIIHFAKNVQQQRYLTQNAATNIIKYVKSTISVN